MLTNPCLVRLRKRPNRRAITSTITGVEIWPSTLPPTPCGARAEFILSPTDTDERRVLSFVVLPIRVGAVLPGTPTWPDLIVDHRHLYEDALDAADDAWQAGKLDISQMESLLESLLAKQLAKIYELAGGKIGTG